MTEKFKEKNKIEKCILFVYFVLEAVIFFLIKWAEFTQPYSVTGEVMYTAIVLNFCVMLYFLAKRRSRIYLTARKENHVSERKNISMVLALFMTLIADYFLTYTDRHFYIGVFCFCIVQFCYACRLGWNQRNLFLRTLLFVIFAWLIRVLGMDIPFSILCGCDIALLIGNVICSWKRMLTQKKMSSEDCSSSSKMYDSEELIVLLAAGLTLFMGCDLSIGLRILSDGIPGMELFHDVMNGLTWVFYLPSQVLLTLCYVFDEQKTTL